MASLDGTPPGTPEEDPEVTAYEFLRQAQNANQSPENRKLQIDRAQVYATLALVREQRRTNRLLSSRKNPPALYAKDN